MLTIQSRSHNYTVETFPQLDSALGSIRNGADVFYLVDRAIEKHYGASLLAHTSPERTVIVEATEENKSFDSLSPVFLKLLNLGLKRNGLLVVIGGGVLQDIGCFIASVLFRGLRWELVPTTLLAQADSCVGSKSSINIGTYKNQIGTFYPPHRVLLTPSVLGSLPWDEIRSGLGEVIKLQLIEGQASFVELMADLAHFEGQPEVISKWVTRSMAVKQPYIETDEYDAGVRNILNYGHTFGHAYESATHYGIPHGIGVILGILTATFLSARMGLVAEAHYQELKTCLLPWHQPFGNLLKSAPLDSIVEAIKRDKKNTGNVINCILTQGPGRMEKRPARLLEDIIPAVTLFIAQEL